MKKQKKYEKVAYVECGLPKIGYIVGKKEGQKFTSFLITSDPTFPLKDWITLNGHEITLLNK